MLKIKLENIVYIILYAVPNAILSFATLYIINNAISGKEEFFESYMWIVFVSIVIYTYILNIIFQKKLNQYTYNILYDNEKNIFQKILQTSLLVFEKLGSQRFYTAIEDIRTFGSFSGVVTHTVNSLLMLLLCLGYMFWISWSSALIVLFLIIVIAGIFFIVMNTMSKKLSTLRKYNEHYYNYVNDVIKGFKNLKIDANKRSNLLGKHLVPNRDEAKSLDYKINFVFLSINLISQYGLYLVIGAILFLLPALGLLSKAEVGSYVVILLFLSGPINTLINLQHVYSQYIVANERINQFLIDFQVVEDDSSSTTPKLDRQFDSLVLNNICFSYDKKESENTFELGPINFKIDKGEMIFVIGGNGSGKSTFINILSGLYLPSSGVVTLNEEITVKHTDIQNLIAAVFTEGHIFSHNYDNYPLMGNKEYTELLKIMELDKVVADDSEESARRTFSKGQSKRMSLVLSLLEDKPILVLDEWAADQDPHFRKYFYENLLPSLKKQGKTIIAVTHDDAYFKHADRIIKFDYGQIIMDKKVTDNIALDSLWN